MNIFWGYEEYFFGVLVILDIFFFFFGGGGVGAVDAGPEPTYEEQIRVAPPPRGSPCGAMSTEGPI